MASISLTDSGGAFERELIEPGLYLAICYQMIQIGTIITTWEGVEKPTPKVRIGWELPDVRKVFKEENGEQYQSHLRVLKVNERMLYGRSLERVSIAPSGIERWR